MKYLPKNTLAYYQAAPQFKAHDFSKLPVAVFAKATKAYAIGCGHADPQMDAQHFYVLNHLASIVKAKFTPSEPLPAWASSVMEQYLKIAVDQSERIIHYITCIIVREMRHQHSVPVALANKVKAQCGEAMYEWIISLKAKNESGAVEMYKSSPPDCNMEQFAKAHVLMYTQKSIWGSSYGGPPWANIANTLLRMVKGETSLEMVLDTGYTLAHNTAPMFNKGMMYDSNYSSLIKILDIQASGQMPELMLDTNDYDFQKPTVLKDVVKQVKAAVPEAFGEWVDWVKVPHKGQASYYTNYIAQQKKQHPEVVSQLFNGKPAQQVGVFAVVPGVDLPVFKRKAA